MAVARSQLDLRALVNALERSVRCIGLDVTISAATAAAAAVIRSLSMSSIRIGSIVQREHRDVMANTSGSIITSPVDRPSRGLSHADFDDMPSRTMAPRRACAGWMGPKDDNSRRR
jgi:hypothetical protein